MKILIYSDNHWCQYSSIVRKRGEKYSLRLENQLKSLNWAEQLSFTLGCDEVVCLGDFFDSPMLNAEEISALRDVTWNCNVKHRFLCGNHEMGNSDLTFNSMNALSMLPFVEVIHQPTYSVEDGVTFIWLPYILEENRKPLTEYIPQGANNVVVFSHNDIKGIQMGKFKSESGFSVDEITQNCKMFLNGHLHNGTKFCDYGFNVGNLTGQNFSENGFEYTHNVYVLEVDENNLTLNAYENPFAFNFYKIDLTENIDFNVFNNVKNAVLTIKCKEKDVAQLKQLLNNNENIVEYRLIIQPETIKDGDVEITELKSVDHLQMFEDYILNTIGNTQTVIDVLQGVMS